MPLDDILRNISSPVAKSFLSNSYLESSPSQINWRFAAVVKGIQKSSKLLSDQACPLHLVSMGFQENEPQLFSRDELLNFKVTVETAEEIRSMLLREGVPKFEVHYISVEVERLYEESYVDAIIRLGAYLNTVQQLRGIDDVPVRVLWKIYQVVHQRMTLLREKMVYELDTKMRTIYMTRIVTYQSQLRYLKTVIAGRQE